MDTFEKLEYRIKADIEEAKEEKARTINSSQLYFSGFPKVKSIAIATAINRNLSGYYKSIRDCEIVIDKKKKNGWLDISPFIDYMQAIFEESMINAKLANNAL